MGAAPAADGAAVAAVAGGLSGSRRWLKLLVGPDAPATAEGGRRAGASAVAAVDQLVRGLRVGVGGLGSRAAGWGLGVGGRGSGVWGLGLRV